MPSQALRKWTLAVVALACGWQMAAAQRTLGLQEAVQLALRKNLGLEVMRNDASAAATLNHPGVAGALPTVSATASDQAQLTDIYQKLATGTEIQRNGALGNNLSANVNGTMVLYNGLRIQATRDRLAQLAQQSQQLLAAEVQNTVAAVMTQYYDVYRQGQYLQTIDASMEVARKNLEIVQARQLAGLANDADHFQALLDLNSLRQQRASQENIVVQATADLLNLLNEDPWGPVTLTDSIVVDSNLSFEALLAGLRSNSQLLAADDQVKVQEFMQQEVTAQRMPTLRGTLGYNFGNNISNGGFNLVSRTLGPYAALNLSVPIYNGSSIKRQEEVAALGTMNARLEREALLDQQSATLFQAWNSYRNALELLGYAHDNHALSRRLLDLMQQKYALRQATILELKQAQSSFEETGYRLVNLQFAVKAAEIELRRLGGRLP